MSIPLPADSCGRIARHCPLADCSPGYFKINTDTVKTPDQTEAYCPYCRHVDDTQGFATTEQLRYAEDIAMKELHEDVNRMVKNAFGLGYTNKKRVGNGLISMEISYRPGSTPHVRRPFEEDLQRAVICPHCSLDHAVFGLAVWCPNCGHDIFMTHVEAEYSVVRTILSDVDRRRNDLGTRIAARDVENCLEDIVSIYEAVLRALLRRSLRNRGMPEEEIETIFKNKVRNRFQDPTGSAEIIQSQLSVNLFESQDPKAIETLKLTFGKRNPITHNLGVVDRKYINTVLSAEREGRELRVVPDEITHAIDISLGILRFLHGRLFP
jgi:hypothetical protein